MATLIDLAPQEREHWKLHLNAVIQDTPSVEKEANKFLKGSELPKIKHPAYIHDWLEQPDEREEIEKNG